MDLFHIVSEERIKKAYEDGEFENLPGMGKPLPLDDLAGVPEELRMAYKLLKNAGYTEEEGHLRREMTTIEDLMKKCDDPGEREGLRRKLNEKLLRFNQMMSKRGVKTNSSFFKNYEHKVQNKLK
ncbi:DnaJ family domain-containing protein [Bacillus sp. UNC438CL73TsuS30]|uniref:DnaJ family domain-containing protein n=1 Tax=Bacillus sp. UNC438CL73TsuS30 TaxID=1340434 RepID=UPI0004790CAC|nr:DnaJ family domain-containing protein [Bacillus sp. UNC438CL73TsuS30]